MSYILVLIGIIEFVIVLKLDKFTFERYKNYKWVAIVYLMFVIANVLCLNSIEYIQEIINNSTNIIIDQIVLILLAMSFSLIYSSLFVAVIQKLHERSVIKKKEKKTEYPKYEYYREVLKDVSPAMLAYVIIEK